MSNHSYFFIIGAQRSGTTYLYQILDEHKEITMAQPVRPEPKFFLKQEEFKLGEEFYLNKYFSKRKDSTRVFGEKGTSYIEYDFAAERIYKFSKTAKIIVILRNPVTRALSNYLFSKDNGLETRSLREVFIDKVAPPPISIETSVSPFRYLERGHYADFLKPYRSIFGDNLRIIIFEELVNNINQVNSIYKFLNVDENFIPSDLQKKVNEGDPHKLINSKDLKPVISVLKEYYKSHITELESFINRDLKFWHD